MMYQPKCEFYLFDKFVSFPCSTWESKKDIVVTTYRERVSAENARLEAYRMETPENLNPLLKFAFFGSYLIFFKKYIGDNKLIVFFISINIVYQLLYIYFRR